MATRLTIPKDLADTLFDQVPEVNAKMAGMRFVNVNFVEMYFDDKASFTFVWGSLINMLRELWVEDKESAKTS